MDDHRKSPRVDFREPVRYAVKDSERGPGRGGDCLSCDLSAGGIRIRADEFIPLQADLTLDFNLQPDAPLAMEGRVAWVQKVPHAETYQIGVQFRNAVSDSCWQRSLREFIQSREGK